MSFRGGSHDLLVTHETECLVVSLMSVMSDEPNSFMQNASVLSSCLPRPRHRFLAVYSIIRLLACLPLQARGRSKILIKWSLRMR